MRGEVFVLGRASLGKPDEGCGARSPD